VAPQRSIGLAGITILKQAYVQHETCGECGGETPKREIRREWQYRRNKENGAAERGKASPQCEVENT